MRKRAEDYCAVVLRDRDVEQRKPHPQIFLRAAERLGVIPARCLVIEDAVMEARATEHAPMACLAMATSHPAEGLGEADLVLASLTEDLKRLVGIGQRTHRQ